jgi:hypothetical protein
MRLLTPATAVRPGRVPAPAPRAALLACLALPFVLTTSASAAATRQLLGTAARPVASATLVQCVTAVEQAERSATFAGEITAIPGSTHLQVRIDVLERLPQEALFHTVSAPGLGVWRGSAPGVKVYRYLKQVTNLSAPAFYRGAVHFRWLNAKGRLMKAEELRTSRCEQPAPPAATAPAAAGSAPVGG